MSKTGRADALRQVEGLFSSGVVGGLTDAQLLRRFVSLRDERAFSALLERHGPLVLRVCRDVLHDRHTADDAFQATFLVLARKAEGIRVRDNLSGWLYEVARRVSLRARTEATRRRHHEQQAAARAFTVTRSTTPLDGSDIGAIIHQEMARLPEAYRSPLTLCYLQGMTYEAAARYLQLSESTVRGRLARARECLRSRLTQRGVEIPLGLTIAGSLASTTSAAVVLPRFQITVKTAHHLMIKRVFPGDMANSSVATLTERIAKAMLISKFKMISAVLLIACGLVTTTAMVHSRIARASDLPDPEPNPLNLTIKETVGDRLPLRGNAKTPEAREEPIGDQNGPEDHSEPKGIQTRSAKPWKTAVRIKVHGEGAIAFGSGTVIHSTPMSSLILTALRPFQVEKRSLPIPREFTLPIKVDLFDGVLQRPQAQVRHASETFLAEAVDFDADADLALIRIRPGRILPSSRVVPKSWQARSGMAMTTAGCSEGNDATFWTTTIINPKRQDQTIKSLNKYIMCEFAPKQGRTGGGLFTSDGYLAGICLFADSQNDKGYYVHPRSIHRILDRNDLSFLYAPSKIGRWEALTGPSQDRMSQSRMEGTVLFIQKNNVLRPVTVFYDKEEAGLNVSVPSSADLNTRSRAWQLQPTGLRPCAQTRVGEGTQITIEGPFTGTATIILAESDDAAEAFLHRRSQNRQDLSSSHSPLDIASPTP